MRTTRNTPPPVSSMTQPQEESSKSDVNDSPTGIITSTVTPNENSIPSNETAAVTTATTTNSKKIQGSTWNPFRWAVLRLKMTEPAMTSPLNYGKYNDDPDATFHCAYCHHTLFPASAKYNSGTGWPSFWRTANTDSVSYHREWDGRLECLCANCQSHLGHVFLDGPHPSSINNPELVQSIPTTDPKSTLKSNHNLPRFCINGLALTYKKKKKK